MPEYYSYCDIVLCIGNFVEAFSNVAIESLLCSTPVICSNIATYKTIPVRKYLNIVKYGDINEIIQTITTLVNNGFENPESIGSLKEAIEFINKNLSVEKFVDGFETIFKNTIHLTMSPPAETSEKHLKKTYRLASWCSCINNKIFDDYKGEYVDDIFKGFFFNNSIHLSEEYLIKNGISQETIENGITEGIIIED